MFQKKMDTICPEPLGKSVIYGGLLEGIGPTSTNLSLVGLIVDALSARPKSR